MVDQKSVDIHHVPFLIEQLSYLIKQSSKCQTELVLWCILTTFRHEHGSFALSVDVFKKIHQKLKSLNLYEM